MRGRWWGHDDHERRTPRSIGRRDDGDDLVLGLATTGIDVGALAALDDGDALRLSSVELSDEAGLVRLVGTAPEGVLGGSRLELAFAPDTNEGWTATVTAIAPPEWSAFPDALGGWGGRITFVGEAPPRLTMSTTIATEDATATRTARVDVAGTLDLAATSPGLARLIGVSEVAVTGNVVFDGGRPIAFAWSAQVAGSLDLGLATLGHLEWTVGASALAATGAGRNSWVPFAAVAGAVTLIDGHPPVRLRATTFDLAGFEALADVSELGVSPDALASLFGVDLESFLPEALQGVTGLQLDTVTFAARLDGGSVEVTSAGATVSCPTPWILAESPVRLVVDDIVAEFTVTDPGGAAHTAVALDGTFGIGDTARLAMSAAAPDFEVTAWLEPGTHVDLAAVIGAVAGQATGLPELGIWGLDVSASPTSQRFSIELEGTWTVAGVFGVDSVALHVERSDDGVEIEAGGRVVLGDVAFDVNAQRETTGAWNFSGRSAPGAAVPLGSMLLAVAQELGVDTAAIPDALATVEIESVDVDFDSSGDRFGAAFSMTMGTSGTASVNVVAALRRDAQGSRTFEFRGELDLGSMSLDELVEGLLAEAGAHVDLPSGLTLRHSSVEFTDEVHLVIDAAAGGGDVRVDLWRTPTGWRPLVQVDGAELPEMALPESVAEMLRSTTLRWAPAQIALAERLGTTPGPVGAGVTLMTVLPFHLTPVGELLGLGDTPIPIEIDPEHARLSFEIDLLSEHRSIDLELIVIRSLLVGYVSPAALSVSLGCDLRLEFGGTTTELRFAGAVRADLVEREVTIGVAFLGRVENGRTVDWHEPFGFPGLTVGRLELWIGPGLRAIRGDVAVGRASLDLDLVWDPTEPGHTAIHFVGTALTFQELLDGFLGPDAPSLPGPLGESGFQEISVDYAAATFPFDWLSGSVTYEQGLRGHAHANLFGLSFAVVFELEGVGRRRFAGSMEPLRVGSILALTSRADRAAADWAAGFSDLGGPFLELDLGDEPRGALGASVSLFGGAITKEIDGRLDADGLSLELRDSIEVLGLTWATHISLGFHERNGVSSIAMGGGIDTSIRLNPAELIGDFLPDIDLVDIAFHLDVHAEMRTNGVSGGISAALVLWGKRIGFSLEFDVDLDFAGLAQRAVDALEEAAIGVLDFFKDIAEAIAKAVEFVVDKIIEFGKAVVALLHELEALAAEVAAAFEALGEAIAELAESAWNEFTSWFGDDSGKRDHERRKRLADQRHRRLQAEETARRADARRKEHERELLLLDVIENLADGVLIDAARADAVQARISTCHLTGINPFTETPEWNRARSGAYWTIVWQDALRRARTRDSLRATYRDALDGADQMLDDLDRDLEWARTDLAQARTALDDAQRTLDTTRQRRDEVRAAADQTMAALATARNNAARLDIALDTADTYLARLGDELRALAGRAQGDHVDLAEATRQRLVVAIAELDGVARGHEAEAAAALRTVDAAEARLRDAEAFIELVRSCRASLTLARLDAVMRSSTGALSGADAFAAWVTACESAGSPALVNLGILRPLAEELLRSLGDLTAEHTDATLRSIAALAPTPDQPVDRSVPDLAATIRELGDPASGTAGPRSLRRPPVARIVAPRDRFGSERLGCGRSHPECLGPRDRDRDGGVEAERGAHPVGARRAASTDQPPRGGGSFPRAGRCLARCVTARRAACRRGIAPDRLRAAARAPCGRGKASASSGPRDPVPAPGGDRRARRPAAIRGPLPRVVVTRNGAEVGDQPHHPDRALRRDGGAGRHSGSRAALPTEQGERGLRCPERGLPLLGRRRPVGHAVVVGDRGGERVQRRSRRDRPRRRECDGRATAGGADADLRRPRQRRDRTVAGRRRRRSRTAGRGAQRAARATGPVGPRGRPRRGGDPEPDRARHRRSGSLPAPRRSRVGRRALDPRNGDPRRSPGSRGGRARRANRFGAAAGGTPGR
ncbi:MAG: hypothetical protein R2705_07800 [Ilumatobacteraceae bacterium]